MSIINIKKPKIPKGLSYVLKTSLEKALEAGGLDCQVDLHYWNPKAGGPIFEADYLLPNTHCPYHRVNVRAGVVPSGQRKQAAEILESQILAEFVKWLKKIQVLPTNSTLWQGKLHFNASYTDGVVQVQHDFKR